MRVSPIRQSPLFQNQMKTLFLILTLLVLGFAPLSPPPTQLPKILDSFEAVELLSHSLNIPEPEWLVGPEDSVYLAPTEEDVSELLCFIKDRRQLIHYVRDAVDCDDFATEAKYLATVWHSRNYDRVSAGLLFGKAYVKLDGNYELLFPGTGNRHVIAYHVINFVVRADGKVFFFEPQSGRIAPVESFIYEDSIQVLRLEY